MLITSLDDPDECRSSFGDFFPNEARPQEKFLVDSANECSDCQVTFAFRPEGNPYDQSDFMDSLGQSLVQNPSRPSFTLHFKNEPGQRATEDIFL